MKRTILTSLSLLAAATLGFIPTATIAAEKAATAEKKAEKAEVKDATGKTPAAATEAATKEASKEASNKPFPYSGKVSKIDGAGKSITLAGKAKERVIVIDAATKVTKDGKPATLAELKVGEEVTGQVTKSGEDQIAKSVKIGGKAGTADPTAGGTTDPAAKPGTAPVKGATTTPGTGALAPATAETKSGAGSPGSSSAGPAVKGVTQPGGQAPAGAKKN